MVHQFLQLHHGVGPMPLFSLLRKDVYSLVDGGDRLGREDFLFVRVFRCQMVCGCFRLLWGFGFPRLRLRGGLPWLRDSPPPGGCATVNGFPHARHHASFRSGARHGLAGSPQPFPCLGHQGAILPFAVALIPFVRRMPLEDSHLAAKMQVYPLDFPASHPLGNSRSPFFLHATGHTGQSPPFSRNPASRWRFTVGMDWLS